MPTVITSPLIVGVAAAEPSFTSAFAKGSQSMPQVLQAEPAQPLVCLRPEQEPVLDMDVPITQYASLGGAEIAYLVIGEGPFDLVYVNGLSEHLDVQWDHPLKAQFLERLASFSRLIMFDRRGAGASDPVPLEGLPTWEGWIEDLGAVLDAAGSQRAAIFAELDAGPVGVIFAATHPERTSALILGNTSARFMKDTDYPWGFSSAEGEQVLDLVREGWGTEEFVRLNYPDADPALLRWRAKFMRASATPRTAAEQYRYILGFDVRSMLATVAAPTLVMARSGYALVPSEHGRYLADHIPGAKFMEIPGSDAGFFTEGAHDVLDEIEEFVTGVRPVVAERLLATLLFTDIVGSTERAAAMGDRDWRTLLEAHYGVLRAVLDQFGGHEGDTAGDGFFATFSGPGRALGCARAMRDAAHSQGLEIRVGLHTGEVEVVNGKVAGIAVHIAARVAVAAQPGEVLVSRTVADLVTGSGLSFRDRGVHGLKGVPGRWHLWALDA